MKWLGGVPLLLALAACGRPDVPPEPLANEAAALDRQIEARGNQLAAEAEAEAEATAQGAIAEGRQAHNAAAAAPGNTL